ncbi:hypothetical protein OH76DRAFT_1066712 [Lentinus brumalis]|uniref:HMG box domain-containing protein n=1 Tax=Lentinus brumalis TaxID=2498619 RepID=A0A371DNM2_9APHY|nr:hypothetical protein OH76DRAFT_1066712 [Polyporus brumalis]
MARNSSSVSAGSDRRSKKKREGHIPRPPNSFIIFRSVRCKEMKKDKSKPVKTQRLISAEISHQWRQLPEYVKEHWKYLAKLAKEEHERKYPGYQYRPQRRLKSKDASPEPQEEPSPTKEVVAPAATTAKSPVRRRRAKKLPEQDDDEVLGMTLSKDVPGGKEEESDGPLQAAYLEHESPCPSGSEFVADDEILLRPVEDLYREQSLEPITLDQSPEYCVGSVNPYRYPSLEEDDNGAGELIGIFHTPSPGPEEHPSESSRGTVNPHAASFSTPSDEDSAFEEMEDLFIQYDQPDSELGPT